MEMFIADRKIPLLFLFFTSSSSMHTNVWCVLFSSNMEKICISSCISKQLEIICRILNICARICVLFLQVNWVSLTAYGMFVPGGERSSPITSPAKQRLVSLRQHVLTVWQIVLCLTAPNWNLSCHRSHLCLCQLSEAAVVKGHVEGNSLPVCKVIPKTSNEGEVNLNI